MYDMYRRLALAKYEERYVIPSAYVNQGHQLEETATECVLSFDGGPGIYESGPFGEASGGPVQCHVAAGVVAQSDREHPGRRSSAVPVQQVDPGRVLGDGGPPAYFQVRVMIGLTLFALWPFTRLVHAFSAPIGYPFRPYVV